MRIRTQFRITILLSGVILVIAAASVILTGRQVGETVGQEEIANEVARGAAELGYLANDYLIYRESQQLKRWQSRFAAFSAQVGSLRPERPEEQALVRNIQANQQRLKEVFGSLTSAVTSPPQKQSIALDLTFLQVSWSRMAVQSQGLVSDASRLSQLLHADAERLKQINMLVIFAMMGAFGVYFLINYTMIQRRILKSIATLQADTKAIGSGNLDFIIEEKKKNDEIGDLSRAFNRMTKDLKKATASKTDLEREIVERERAQVALRESEQRWATTLASIGDAVIATDVSARITFMNTIAESLTGWKRNEASDKFLMEVFNIINEPTRQKGENPVTKVLEKGNIVGLANHTLLVRKDGTEVPIDDSGAPIRDLNGKTTGVVLVFRDITERKKAEAALHDSEERMRFALETSHTGAWDLDLIDHTAFRSLEHDRIFGYNQLLPQWTYETFLDHVLPEDKAMVDEKFGLATRTMTDWSFECRIRRADGEIRWIWAAGHPHTDVAGNPRRMAGIVQDITERKRNESRLAAQYAMTQAMADSVTYHEAVPKLLKILADTIGFKYGEAWTLDENTEKLRWENSWSDDHRLYENMLLISRQMTFAKGEGVPGQTWQNNKVVWYSDLAEYPGFSTTPRAATFQRLFRGLIAVPIKSGQDLRGVFLFTSDQKSDLSHDRLTLLESTSNRIGQYFDSKRAETKLRESEQRFSTLYSSMTEGVAQHEIIYNAAGQAIDYEIIDVNPAFEKITGLRRDIAVGKKASELYGTGTAPYLDIYEKVATSGQAETFVTHFPPMKKHFNISAFSPAKGKFATVFQDITDRKRAEEALKKAHEELQDRAGRLEAANKELEGFGYSVSHDLRSPLRAIAGFTRMILDEKGGTFDPETRRKFGIIQENAEKMGQLIDDLLRLSRLGRAELHWSKLDMGGLVREVMQEIQMIDPQREWVTEIGDLPAAQGDPALIRQLLANLLSNAIKFTRGRLGARIEVGSFERSGERVYYVKDNGVGFDMKYYNKLFGVFQRLVSESQFEGTGVGLAIVQRIVQRHGGRVWAEGQIQEGATFYFTLPPKEQG